jgi:hypothetical protein
LLIIFSLFGYLGHKLDRWHEAKIKKEREADQPSQRQINDSDLVLTVNSVNLNQQASYDLAGKATLDFRRQMKNEAHE